MATAPDSRIAPRVRGPLMALRVAFRGVGIVLRTQPTAWIHTVATLAVFAAGFSFRLRGLEWCCVILAIGLVWVAEALNTAIETLTDLASPEMHPLAGRAKDIAAGAVLMASIIAVAVGAVLFGPRFWDMLPGK